MDLRSNGVDLYLNEKHIPSSSIVVIVHVVKGCQYNAYSLHRCRSLSHRESDGVWDWLATSMVTSFNAFITDINLTAQYNFQTLDRLWCGMAAWCVLYIAQAGFIFVYGIKRTREVRPAVLVREGNALLVKYLLDKCVRYSTYLLIFKSWKGSIEALNVLMISS